MRRKRAPKRELLPDPKHRSELLAKFTNHLMLNGEKSIAERIVYGALEEAEKRMKGKAIEIETKKYDKRRGQVETDEDEGDSGDNDNRQILILRKALSNISPSVEVRARRVGGATYQVPVEVRSSRSRSLGMRWLIDASKSRHEKSMTLRLAAEIIEACEGRGAAVKKRDDTHRMAKANQAFAHYRW